MEKLNLTGIVWKEGNQYVSLCPQIDISSFGDSIEEAFNNLKDAVQLYLKDEDLTFLPHQKAVVKNLVLTA